MLCVKRNDGSVTQNLGSCRVLSLSGGCCFAQAAMRRSGRKAESLAMTGSLVVLRTKSNGRAESKWQML